MADPIKDAFQKVKEDMLNLQNQLTSLSNQILELKRTLDTKNQSDRQSDNQTDRPTNHQSLQTFEALQTDNQTLPQEIKGLNRQNIDTSTGNKGVQTDRPTNQQTDRQIPKTDIESSLGENLDRQTDKFALIPNAHSIFPNMNSSEDTETKSIKYTNTFGNISRVSQVLNSLDSLKQDLYKQFKRLTPQEMLVFSTVYQLTDQNIHPDYSLLAIKTNLSESSIRDYVQKLIKKGIPLDKTKENNKRVTLYIPLEFKRMASLQTLYELRNL